MKNTNKERKFKAFVFDTNFIIQFQRLDLIIRKLKKTHTVYITEVSRDERISQQLREIDSISNDLNKSLKKLNKYISIKFKKDLQTIKKELENNIRIKYTKTFNNNYIPIDKSDKSFSEIIKRSFNKIPPFSSANDSSDKGFKDTLLWLSLISFFADKEENEIVFLTNDKAFLDNKDFLIKEFKEKTQKDIFIEHNSYFNNLVDNSDKTKDSYIKSVSEENDALRSKAREALYNICMISRYEGVESDKTFITHMEFDRDFILLFFHNLPDIISAYYFRSFIPASTLFDNNPEIQNGTCDISISSLEHLNYIIQTIYRNNNRYWDSFVDEATRIMNLNFIPKESSSKIGSYEYDDPPF